MSGDKVKGQLVRLKSKNVKMTLSPPPQLALWEEVRLNDSPGHAALLKALTMSRDIFIHSLLMLKVW